VPPFYSVYNSSDFVRFENGKVLFVWERYSPLAWMGSYRKKGWGQYEIEWFFEKDNPVRHNFPLSVRSTFFFVKDDNEFGDIVFKDPLWRNPFLFLFRNVLNASVNDWVWQYRREGINLRVIGTAEERRFIFGTSTNTNTLQELETALNRIMHDPLPIYTASNEVPSHIIEIVAQNGLDYQVHSNQQWVAEEWEKDYPLKWFEKRKWKDTHDPDPVYDANPVWTNRMFKLIIGPDNSSDLCLQGRYRESLRDFKKRIDSRRKGREAIKTNLYLYAEDGVLPEDVRQMLEPFGIDYHVRDARTLYRGKRKGTQ